MKNPINKDPKKAYRQGYADAGTAGVFLGVGLSILVIFVAFAFRYRQIF